MLDYWKISIVESGLWILILYVSFWQSLIKMLPSRLDHTSLLDCHKKKEFNQSTATKITKKTSNFPKSFPTPLVFVSSPHHLPSRRHFSKPGAPDAARFPLPWRISVRRWNYIPGHIFFLNKGGQFFKNHWIADPNNTFLGRQIHPKFKKMHQVWSSLKWVIWWSLFLIIPQKKGGAKPPIQKKKRRICLSWSSGYQRFCSAWMAIPSFSPC